LKEDEFMGWDKFNSLQTGFLLTLAIEKYNKSRMMGDYHVRFCERLGVKFPLSTRPKTVRFHNLATKSFMEKILNKQELEKLENFIGYGRDDAEIIFFGLEEAGGGWENLKTRIKIKNYDYLDCKRFHLDNFEHKKPYKLHYDDESKKVNFQPVWKFMSYLMLKLENKSEQEIFSNNSDLLRSYQNNYLGTKNNNGKTLLTEIFPIPCSSLKHWGTKNESYTSIIPFYKDKKEYQNIVLEKRVELFKKFVKSENYQAKAIICFGKSHWKDFKKFFNEFNVEFKELSLSKTSKVGLLENGTKVFLIPFLGNGQVSYKFIDELVSEIR